MKAYKFRIYPNVQQQELIAKHFGCSRHVYNWALAEKKAHYEETQKNLSRTEIQQRLVKSKKGDKPWLKEVNSQSLLSALFHLEDAFNKFFREQNAFPHFKSKYDSEQSFHSGAVAIRTARYSRLRLPRPQHVKVDFEAGLLFLPKFKQGIKTKFHRYFEGQIKTVTIRRKPSGKFFVSILVDEQKEPVLLAPVSEEQTLGIDLGLTHFLIDSEGNKTDNPRFLKASLEKLAKEQKIFARKQTGSKNRQKQKLKVARVHEHVVNQRLDFLHKLTAKLVFKALAVRDIRSVTDKDSTRYHATSYAIEDLSVRGMLQNHTLSRSIIDVSWSKFKELLKYKCAWTGKNVLEIGRFEASSKLCSHCGYKHELDLSVRYWVCPHCQAEHDRDINAAVNIKRLALFDAVIDNCRADALGHSVCLKSSPEAILFSHSASAKDANRHGSQEAPTTAAGAV